MIKANLKWIATSACVLLAMTGILFSGTVHAASVDVNPSLTAATQQLAIEQERNIVARDRLQELQREKQQQMQMLKPEQVELEDVRRAELDINLLQVDLSAIILTLADVDQTMSTLTHSIQEIKQQLQDAAFAPTGTAALSALEIQKLNQRFETQQQLLKLQQKRHAFLKESQKLVKNRLEMQQEWKTSLEEAYEAHEHEKRQRALEQLEGSMQLEQQKWIERLATLNKQTKVLVEQGKTQTPEYVNLTLRIFEAEERGNMSQLQSNLMQLRLQISDDIAAQVARAQSVQSINEWNNVNSQIDASLIRLETMRTLIEGKIDLIQQRQSIESEGKASGILDAKGVQANLNLLSDLAARNQQQLKIVDALIKQVGNYKLQVTKNLRSAVARRQGLPGFNLKEWVTLGKKLASMPTLGWDFVKTVQKQLISSIDRMSAWKQSFCVLLGALWLAFCVFLSRTLKHVLAHFHERTYWTATNILELLLKLILHNLTGIFVFVTLLLIFWMTYMPAKVYALTVSVGVIWFGMQFALDWAKITLFENAKNDDGHDIKLYHTIRWVMFVASLLILFIVLSYQLPVDYEVRDFFSRVSMLFLLGIALALLKGRNVILSVLYPYLARNHHYLKRHYLKRIFYLLTLLFPLMLILNALVGLVGYLELSWTIAQYQAYFLLIFTGYLVTRGLLRDLTEWLSGLVIRRLRNGWLWSEAILKPLDRLCNVVLVVLATLIMFSLIEQGQESFISNKIFEWFQIRLGSIAGSEVTPMMIAKLAIAIIILFWIGRWSREFAYRWFFVNMKDVGLRNSLSVFSQYIAVLVGIFICLRILGLNMVAFAAILTGLAIGIGFGLRDLANNFVSGIFLLIERPVRKGDLVTIAGYEGEVTHIGMRSLTVYTGDHTEVIVPHSEAFSKTFVNWTLQDSIVRGTVVINIARDDDPHGIKVALEQILKETPGVVANPLPEVLLKDINDTAIEFQIHYFINLQVTPFRSVMRSTVLFSVWDCLSKMGIRPLHAQQDVHIKALPVPS